MINLDVCTKMERFDGCVIVKLFQVCCCKDFLFKFWCQAHTNELIRRGNCVKYPLDPGN